ncbi:MAG TPA: ATP-dependent DNA helicase RecG [Flavobacteriaceae bacterium]|nr:ATP-dependent DNA helicase RecG [Flavobacteriaceae bacterium]
MSSLQTPIEYLKGVGPYRASLLKSELDIHTYQDLLHFFPNRYLDRTKYYLISELRAESAEVQVIGQVLRLQEIKQKRGSRLVALFQDAQGSTMELVWFRGHKWIKENIRTNTHYVIFGKLNWFKGKVSMPHPEMELLSEHQQKTRPGLYPIYPSTDKLSKARISNKFFSNLIEKLIKSYVNHITESLSDSIIEELNLISKKAALWFVHFPKNQESLARAQQRLKFEELFYIQLQLVRKKVLHQAKVKGYPFESIGDKFLGFYENHLPFELTNAQKRVVREIRKDLGSNAQMNRLLQGDVGSGKTIVAFLSMLIALDNEYQACLMAPTEILATQHYQGLKKYCDTIGVTINLLTGSSTTKERKEIHEGLESGELQILVGTHAVLEDKVVFANLGYAIIDEQHRFGVEQRSKLWHKNELPPHILVMTATPIPRTLAMNLYGDLDISVIDELPPGRKPIKTLHKYDSNRLAIQGFMREEIAKGRQVYVVYPLIEESAAMEYKNLMEGYESLSRDFPMPEYHISVVHGQMSAADKEYEMQRFASGKTDIMVATTVIEVGVNVPNASVMVIESAERFGLSQLHQLRGRVGRGAEQSYCILVTSYKLSNDSKTRMQTMVNTNDGFEIAEVDLKLRGPGNLMGTQQSGVLNLQIADIVQDGAILQEARKQAILLMKQDPELKSEENKPIRSTFNQLMRFKNIWSYIS